MFSSYTIWARKKASLSLDGATNSNAFLKIIAGYTATNPCRSYTNNLITECQVHKCKTQLNFSTRNIEISWRFGGWAGIRASIRLRCT